MNEHESIHENGACAFCGTINQAGLLFCAGCGAVLPPLPGGVPWEKRRRLGFVSALLDTIYQMFRQPGVFFASVRGERTRGGAFLFAATIDFFAVLFETLWTLALFEDAARENINYILTNMMHLENSAEFLETMFQYIMAAQVITAPLLSIVGVYIVAALTHLGLIILNIPGRKYVLVLWLIAFTRVARLALILPEIGGLLASLLTVVFTMVAFRYRFPITWGKAIFLAMIPSLASVLILMLLGGLGVMGG